jgi:flagellar biosynthesis protein FliR
MIAGEVVTGLWFGWLARMIVLALPVGAQLIGYMIGLSSVLQPDPELGAQSSVLGKLFEMVAPVILLISGLYKLVLTALDGLFRLIPPVTCCPRRIAPRSPFIPLESGSASPFSSPRRSWSSG